MSVFYIIISVLFYLSTLAELQAKMAEETPHADSARLVGCRTEGDHDHHQHQQRRQTKKSMSTALSCLKSSTCTYTHKIYCSEYSTQNVCMLYYASSLTLSILVHCFLHRFRSFVVSSPLAPNCSSFGTPFASPWIQPSR